MFRTIGFRFSGTAVSPHKNIQKQKVMHVDSLCYITCIPNTPLFGSGIDNFEQTNMIISTMFFIISKAISLAYGELNLIVD